MRRLAPRFLSAAAIAGLVGVLFLCGSPAVGSGLQFRARETLWRAFNEESGWVKIHAAEALIACGSRSGVEQACRAASQAPTKAGFPLTGYWRVMARCTEGTGERMKWVDLLKKRALDSRAADWVLGVESLAKLAINPDEEECARFRRLGLEADPSDALFVWWLLAATGDREARETIADAIESPDAKSRLRAAMILKHLQPPDAKTGGRVIRAAEREPGDSPAFPYLAGAAAALDPARAARWRARLEEVLVSGRTRDAYAAAQELLSIPGRVPEETLTRLLEAAPADMRIGAASLILKEPGRP